MCTVHTYIGICTHAHSDIITSRIGLTDSPFFLHAFAAFYIRSQAYIKMSMLENAIQDYKRALLVDPGKGVV